MENETSKIVTFEDLAKYTKVVISPMINDGLVAFAEYTLLPSIDQMFGDFRVEMAQKFSNIDNQFADIHAELSDIKSEISAII